MIDIEADKIILLIFEAMESMFDLSKYKKLNRYVRMAVLFYHQHPTRALEMIIVHCLGKLRNITGIEMTINLSTRLDVSS